MARELAVTTGDLAKKVYVRDLLETWFGFGVRLRDAKSLVELGLEDPAAPPA